MNHELKLMLAIDAVEKRNLVDSEQQNVYGEGFLAGLEMGLEMAMKLARTKQRLIKLGVLQDEATKVTKVIRRRSRA